MLQVVRPLRASKELGGMNLLLSVRDGDQQSCDDLFRAMQRCHHCTSSSNKFTFIIPRPTSGFEGLEKSSGKSSLPPGGGGEHNSKP